MIARSIGKYRVLDRIGRGGMGTVYRAVDDTLQREVAIKVLNAELTEPEALKRFRTEAITLAKLHHPSIAMLFELHEENGELMMVMEYVPGETLQKLAERMGRMPPDFAAQLCAQALDGLAHAHRAGIIHRDLKPGNIMVTGDGLVKVMDFGIARIAGSEHLTTDGLTMGTPAYMAPEQVLGQEVDARADVYAMGVVLYRLWTGQLPFDGDTPFAIVDKQLHEAPRPLNLACPDLPPWCEAVMARALAKNAADRFQTAQEFKAALVSSATFVSLDDLATATMQTPRAVPLEAARNTGVGAPRSASVPSSVSGQLGRPDSSRPSIPADRPQPAPLTAPSGRTVVISARDMFAGVGAIVLVVVLLVIGGFIAMRRLQVKTATQVTAASTPVTPSASESGAPPAPTPATPAAPSVLPVTTARQTTASAPQVTDAGSQKRPPEPALGSARGTNVPVPANPSAGAPAAVTAAASTASTGGVATAPPAPALPAVTFDKLKLVVMEGDKAHEEDASVQFADGRIVIFGQGGRLVASMPYGAVRCLSSARSRQPRWRGPDGAVAETKISGGALGFMKSDRNWVGIATQKAAYVLRVDDGRVTSLGQSAAQRTGVPVVRLSK